MNKHLNIFTTYTKKSRVYQLENDLTRALAICLQEDTLFFHEVLKVVFGNSNLYNQFFEALEADTNIQIEIQKQTSQINEFEHVFAVSLSESPMSDFWAQTYNAEYDPICDLVITIDNVLIVIEAKRDNVNCTAQLYNQVLNIHNNQNKALDKHKEKVTAFDLNWPKLMTIAVKVASFEKTTGNQNRFLFDFIQLVKDHNFKWLPEPPIRSLLASNTNLIYRRLETALTQFCKENESVNKLHYKDRLGCTFAKGWANELLFNIDSTTGDLVVVIYPGNTKGQGYHIFNTNPAFHKELNINGNKYSLQKSQHIKFSGQAYITGIWFTEDQLIKELYTKENFHNHTGRIHRSNWDTIENLLNEHLNFDWKRICNWDHKLTHSNRKRFDISFGYQVSIRIPFKELQALDETQKDISGLSNLLEKVYSAFEHKLIK